MIYLRLLRLNVPASAPGIRAGNVHGEGQALVSRENGRHPFNLPLLESLTTMEFDSPVTIFVGENGTGKSTILEALAVAAESIAVGGLLKP